MLISARLSNNLSSQIIEKEREKNHQYLHFHYHYCYSFFEFLLRSLDFQRFSTCKATIIRLFNIILSIHYSISTLRHNPKSITIRSTMYISKNKTNEVFMKSYYLGQ